MRWVGVLLMFAWLSPAVAQAPGAQPPCPAAKGGSCVASPKDQKEAKKAFQRGVRLRNKNHNDEAFEAFDQAARLVPDNVEYATAREVVRQQLVYEALKRGNLFMLTRQEVQALAEFRTALELDLQNEYAMERMRDALGVKDPEKLPSVRVVASAEDVQLVPNESLADFHYKGDARALIEKMATAYGVGVVFDETFASRQVRLEVDRVGFGQAMELVGRLSKTFWAPISDKQMVVAADTADNRRRFERMALRSFYVYDSTAPQMINELVGTIRSLFDVRFVTPQLGKSIITVRARKDVVDAVSRFLEGFSGGPPQVMLDVKVFEINHTLVRDLGVNLPLQYTLINLSNVLSQIQNQPDIQQLINQLFSGGGINQANAQALQGLLAQLASQQNSILNTPVATFGGGLTLMGLAIPSSSIVAHFDDNTVKTLEHLTMRARQGDASSILIGSRYPILNATFSPIFNTPQIAQVIQNNSFIAPFPSFSYEDLGIAIKTTPQIHATSDVTLQMEMKIRSLTGQSFNGVPIISNREFQGTINLKNGETAMMVSYVNQSETRATRGMPGLGQVPGLRWLVDSEHKEKTTDELLILITPHVISSPQHDNLEVWLAK